MDGRPLRDRTVVVTGGNGGIGLGIARAAAAAGAAVMIWARSEEKSAVALKELQAAGADAGSVLCNVAEEQSVQNAMDATLDKFGRIDGVVANAGIPGVQSSIVDMDADNWRAVMNTNLLGSMFTFRAGALQMIRQGEPGALVAISSIITRFGGSGRSHYAASKAGIHALVMSAAVELAQHRIRCNALAPGWTRTDLLAEGFDDAERFQNAILTRTPARRWGEPDDYAAAAVMLLDPTMSYHTGDLITVDGAYSIC